MAKDWRVGERHAEAARLAAAARVHPVVADLLLKRGLDSAEAARGFLEPDPASLSSPFIFSDMAKAAERLRDACRSKEKILIYGDYDVDGIASSALLYLVLRSMGAEVVVHIPHRVRDGYGVNEASVKELLKEKFSLLVTVDNGIAAGKTVDLLNAKGIDTIVVDHHVPKGDLPAAAAIVTGATGTGGDPDLCGCGLVFKLACALLGGFGPAAEYLDLVALATVADAVPVTGENRVLLREGFKALARTRRPGLSALFSVVKMRPEAVGYREIAFYLAPRINASGRMGSATESFRLLVTSSATEAENLAKLLDEGNRQRQRAETDAFAEAVSVLERDPWAKSGPVIVVDSPDWHEGVLGIVASRLAEKYRKPAIVIHMRGEIGKGSGRSYAGADLLGAVSAAAEHLVEFGGHSRALGLCVEKKKLPFFIRACNEAAAGLIREAPETVFADAVLDPGDLRPDLLNDLGKMEPFGPGNERPVFLTRGLRVRGEVRKRGVDTLSCWMNDPQSGTTCEVVGFRSYSRWVSSPGKGTVDILHQPSLKEYKGIRSIQLELKDWR